MGKLDEKKKQKRDSLLAAAFALFTEKGINDTSISDIANEAKMAKGTLPRKRPNCFYRQQRR